MTQMKHWQDSANVLLGAWLIVSSWALGYQTDMAAAGNSVIIGAALVAVALGAIFVPRAWEEWAEGVLGLWMVISPWVLGFSSLYEAKANAVVTGVVILVLSLWVLLSDKDYIDWRHDRTAP